MPLYVFTQPKAGTYFISDIIARLGFENTGFHVMRNFYLDTHSQSLEDNATQPGLARVDKFFAPVVRSLQGKQFAFGHFPLPLNPEVPRPDMKYVCAYRDPKSALVSEFIDFRFRRKDIKRFSQASIPDDRKAFVAFLKKRGLGGHFEDFRNMLLYRSLVAHHLASPKERDRAHFVNFSSIRSNPEEIDALARFLGVEIAAGQSASIHAAALASETKTKASSIDVDRDALWSDAAEKVYQESGYPAAVQYGRQLGLTFE